MRVPWRSLMLVLACVVGAGDLCAEDPPRPPRPPATSDVAERALKAFDAKDQAAFEALAGQRPPSA